MAYLKRVLVALDQLVATALLGTMPDETISAVAHRRGWKRTEAFINWLFRNDLHCANAYIAEMTHKQNAQEYRQSLYRKEQ